jgi:adenine deaminase
MAVARGGVAERVMPLPIAGLLAETPPEETAAAFAQLREAADAVMDWKPPFRVFRGITAISLACNPGPHPTDLGISDAATGTLRDPAQPVEAAATG